jgi:hypothetical protein
VQLKQAAYTREVRRRELAANIFAPALRPADEAVDRERLAALPRLEGVKVLKA